MKIEFKKITISELIADYVDKSDANADGYVDDGDDRVVGYGGKLDIRPPFQREFVYKPDQRDAVIDTITQGFPLNVMYWAVRDDDDFEIIDG